MMTTRDSDAQEAYFNQLYDTHCQALHAYCFGRCGEPEMALDLLQEIFLRVWRNLRMLEEMPPSQHRYWLFAVARNLLTDHHRRQATRAAVHVELARGAGWLTVPAQEPVARLVRMEEIRQLDAAIRQLPDDLRTILSMSVLGEMTSADIGTALDKPAGTVRYQLHLARKQLAEVVQKMENEV